MLIRFSVENFLSFDKKQEFKLIPGKSKTKQSHITTINGVDLLKLGTIYGANASGKSNFVEAARFVKHCVLQEIPRTKKIYCRTVPGNEEKVSNFDFEFSKNGKFYAYGFSVITEKRCVTQEWLYELLPSENKQKVIFERVIADKYFSCELDLTSESKNRITIYGEDSLDNSSALFLNEINRGKPLEQYPDLKVFQDIYNWFKDNLTIIRPQDSITEFDSFYGDDEDSKINKILSIFDTGISKIKVKEITVKTFIETIDNREFAEMILDDFNDKLIENEKRGEGEKVLRLSLKTPDAFFNISAKYGEEPKITTIKLEHGVEGVEFNFGEESDGTRRLFDLLDILINTKEETVYIIDELDRSLHPKLTYEFVRLFIDLLAKKRVQLVFTTHESIIMDQELLRRDEVWFVERDNNTSILFSLDRFKERYDKKINKSYLEGRYGGIPIFKKLDFNKGDKMNGAERV